MDLHLDPSDCEGYTSPAQITKALSEPWVSREGYCLNCGTAGLARTPENTKAMDFRCVKCTAPYELKASKRPFRTRILDGAYKTLVGAIASQDNPNLLLLNYDFSRMQVTDYRAIPRYALSRLNIVRKKPLALTAQRPGWEGCSIDLAGLPPSALVTMITGGVVRPVSAVLRDWRALEFIEDSGKSAREWLPDILACVRRIPSEEFKVEEVYEFQDELRLLHPKNFNIEPKIRQQLQILVAKGYLDRIRPGSYRKTAKS